MCLTLSRKVLSEVLSWTDKTFVWPNITHFKACVVAVEKDKQYQSLF